MVPEKNLMCSWPRLNDVSFSDPIPVPTGKECSVWPIWVTCPILQLLYPAIFGPQGVGMEGRGDSQGETFQRKNFEK